LFSHKTIPREHPKNIFNPKILSNNFKNLKSN